MTASLHLVDVPTPDGTAQAHVSRPPSAEVGAPEHSVPAVLVFMDAIGLRPQIAAMCDRIASWGYVVLAPNVFYREGTVYDVAPHTDLRVPGEREAFFAKAMPRVGRLSVDLAVRDIAAYIEALRALDGVADGPVATTGYCMGARLAVRAGTGHPDDVVAVGGFHGGGLATDSPDSPHLGLSSARAEFVFGHADKDRSMPPEAVARLGAALAEAGLTATNEVYGGAAHGYTMADTSMYHEAAAERHFHELEVLLRRTLR